MHLLSVVVLSLLSVSRALKSPHPFRSLHIPRSLPNILARDDTNSTGSTNASTSSVVGPVTQFRVANKYIAPDGFNRSATLVNGIFPAPLIRANKNDQFSIQVSNNLTDPTMPLNTTIHWHGIFQSQSNWADGTSLVSQCPLLQTDVFEYDFTPTNQTGTYWYHSHYSTQYCDGVRGPLVIYDPEDPLADLYDVDDGKFPSMFYLSFISSLRAENTVITLSDWYHLPSIALGQEFAPVEPNSTLINGLGRYAGGPSTSLAVVNVQQGLRYRFRVLSTSCNPQFNFSIDGHRMTIIEADGNEVEPVDVDSFPILAGQRYSVVVTANQTAGNFWIRALSSVAGSSFDGGQNMAILRYEGASDVDPTSNPGPYELSFDEGALHPLVSPGAPGVPELGQADVNLQLAAGFNSGFFTFNNVSYSDPPVPVLLQILSGARHASQLLPNGSVYELPANKVIEINFPSGTLVPGGPHPIHLHGHSFDVVRVAGSNVTNFANPIRRDVVSMGNGTSDNVTIRFVTDNPGPWFLHCHIDWHLNHGFAVVMAEAPDLVAQQQSKVAPDEWYDLCSVNKSQILG